MAQPLKIMVVEDDVTLLQLLGDQLTSFGAEVKMLSDSRHAAQLINLEKFHGIITDLNMPHLDGFELARQIRKSSWNKSTPIVIISGRQDPNTMEQAFAVGGTFFLNKPFDRRKLGLLFKAARGSMIETRRRAMRISLLTEVTCLIDSITIRGNSANISLDGILFEAGKLLEPGKTVQLSFALPGQGVRINATGIIARVDEKKRAGVRFTKLDFKDRERIQDLLAESDDVG